MMLGREKAAAVSAVCVLCLVRTEQKRHRIPVIAPWQSQTQLQRCQQRLHASGRGGHPCHPDLLSGVAVTELLVFFRNVKTRKSPNGSMELMFIFLSCCS